MADKAWEWVVLVMAAVGWWYIAGLVFRGLDTLRARRTEKRIAEQPRVEVWPIVEFEAAGKQWILPNAATAPMYLGLAMNSRDVPRMFEAIRRYCGDDVADQLEEMDPDGVVEFLEQWAEASVRRQDQ